MSVPAMTIWAALVAATSVILLVIIDHRKPARRRRTAARGGVGTKRAPSTKIVEHLPTRPYRRTPMWRRVLSFGEIGLLGIVLGALTAIVLATMVIGVFLVIDGATK